MAGAYTKIMCFGRDHEVEPNQCHTVIKLGPISHDTRLHVF